MAGTPPSNAARQSNAQRPNSSPQRENLSQAEASSAKADAQLSQSEPALPPKKRKHRAGKKRRNRRQSFAASAQQPEDSHVETERPSLLDVPGHSGTHGSMFRLRNPSTTSLESQSLLDHRDQGQMFTRRQSVQQNSFASRPSHSYGSGTGVRHHTSSTARGNSHDRFRPSRTRPESGTETDEDDDADDITPLISAAGRDKSATARNNSGYGGLLVSDSRVRQRSSSSSRISRKGRNVLGQESLSQTLNVYDVNNPPSMPGSPKPGDGNPFDDVMLMGDETRIASSDERCGTSPSRDAIIDVDANGMGIRYDASLPGASSAGPLGARRRTTIHPAEADVCFPTEGMSEIGDQEFHYHQGDNAPFRRRRRRSRVWPDLHVLEEWSIEEKEQRTLEGVRAKKISEPVLVGGRLRPHKTPWHKQTEDEPYRWTYFNETFQSTIHSQTISELLQPGQTFRDLFIPEPPELSDENSSEEEDLLQDNSAADIKPDQGQPSENKPSENSAEQSPRPSDRAQTQSQEPSEGKTPENSQSHTPREKKERSYGERPTFWLDVLSPTESEMRILQRAFGIHGLTIEDIMMQEDREKVELFRNYYFVSYRSFEQDTNSENYLAPINIYVIVFREGVLSFHNSMTPHPANVRRRMRQLRDYLVLNSDWVSYGIIDDITDAYAPLIQQIEQEVDNIDEDILRMHSSDENSDGKSKPGLMAKHMEYEKVSEAGDGTSGDSGGDMLRRVGECRKKVMSLYRLLGNKADVIKGFAKRCNAQWEVAPRSEIGFYLGDIQDHIVTMTANLSHYENLLSRAHSNYLAQINIRMNERQEQTADVLGKLTVLGTIVLPMNIVTGMWGMNVLVPGQDVDNLWWFFGITAGLLLFGLSSYFIAKRVYGIV